MNDIWKDFRIVGMTDIDESSRCDLVMIASDGETFTVRCDAHRIPVSGATLSVPYYFVGGDLLNFSSFGFENQKPLSPSPINMLQDIWPDVKIPQ